MCSPRPRYKPRYGYKSQNYDKDHAPWIEYSDQQDKFEDLFEKKAMEKKERVTKNEKQRLANLADARIVAQRSSSFAGKAAVKGQLGAAFAITKESTASAGKFDEKLKNEPKAKKRLTTGATKKILVAGDMKEEKSVNLALLKRLEKKAVTIQTAKGTVLADQSKPDLKRQIRQTPKGPSKKAKKAGATESQKTLKSSSRKH